MCCVRVGARVRVGAWVLVGARVLGGIRMDGFIRVGTGLAGSRIHALSGSRVTWLLRL
jgi:hypothetical protein